MVSEIVEIVEPRFTTIFGLIVAKFLRIDSVSCDSFIVEKEGSARS